MLAAAGVKGSDRVLDLATGTGDAALLAIQQVGPYGTSIGVDLSLPMLVVAKSKSSEARLSFVAADAQALPFRDRSFDAAICLFSCPRRKGEREAIQRKGPAPDGSGSLHCDRSTVSGAEKGFV